jgi:PAS domain S-box-containing protein
VGAKVPGLEHAILLLAPDITIVHASPGAATMFGYDQAKDLVGRSGYELLAGADEDQRARERVEEHLAQLRGGARGPWRMRRLDGHEFTVEIEVTYVQEPGAELRILLSLLDATEQQRTRRALDRALEWTDHLLDISGTMIVVLDREGKVARINAEGCRILGYGRDEILGSDWFETYLPERLREPVRGVAQQLYSGAIEPARFFENPVVTASGDERIIYWHNTVTRDDAGNIIEILSSGLDITDRVESEREVRRALDLAQARQAELQALLEATRDVHAATDFEAAAQATLDRCIQGTQASAGVLAHWHAGPEQDPVLVVASGAQRGIHRPESVAGEGSFQAHVLEAGRAVFHNDFPASPWADDLPTGHPPVQNALFAPMRARDRSAGLLGLINKPGGFEQADARLLEGFATVLGMALTERRTEDALRASEQRHRTIVERAANPIARLSLDGTILDCNPQAERIFGYPVEELRGQRATLLIDPDDHERLLIDLTDIHELGTYYQRHYRALRSDGQPIDIEVDASMSMGESGEPEIICLVADVSMRLRAERLERLSNRLLRLFHSEQDLAGLCEAFCGEVRDSTGCAAVAVRSTRPDGAAPWLAQHGFPEALVHDRGALAEGETCGFATLVTVPIRFGKEQIGMIQAAASQPRGIPRDVLSMLDEAALQLGVAMQRIHAEAELQQQLAFQQELLDAIPVPVYYKDARGHMLGWNRAWLRATGWRPAEVQLRRAEEVLPKDEGSLFAQRDRELLERPGRQVFEHSYLGPGGQRREAVFHRATFSRGGARVGGIIGTMVDVTALKRASTALEDLNRNLELRVQERLLELRTLYRLSRALLHVRSVHDLAHAALHHLQKPLNAELFTLAICHGDHCEIFVRSTRPISAPAQERFERQLQAELQRLDIRPQKQEDLVRRELAAPDAEHPAVAELGSSYAVPLQVQGRESHLGVLMVAAEAQEAFTENHVRLLHVAATQLAEGAERLLGRKGAEPGQEPETPPRLFPSDLKTMRRLLDRMPQQALLLDGEQRVVHINRAAATELDLQPDLLVGSPLALCPVPWDWSIVEPSLLPGALRDEGVQLTDLRITRRDGRMGALDLMVLPFELADGARHILLLAEDVTQRRDVESRLHQARKMESIGQLASGIAHEINTPTQYVGDNLQFLGESLEDLEGLLSMLRQLLGEESLPDSLRDKLIEAWEQADVDYLLEELPAAIRQAREGVSRIGTIVGAMREFSHGGSREKTVVDVNRCVRSTVTVARNEWKYVADVAIDTEPDLPSIPTLGAELNQVLLNLLINAAHAVAATGRAERGDKGNIVIRTRRSDDCIQISVEDDGCGIPYEHQARIFEPFFTTKPVGMGTGQGLAISRAIVVEKLGGSLDFESTPGSGSTFTITLPLAD